MIVCPMYDIFTCITSEFVYSARVVVPVYIDCLRFCILLYCVCVFECSVYVGMFEEVGEFSNFWTVVWEGCPFLTSLSCVWWAFCCFVCTSRFVMKYYGKLFFCAMLFIVFHSVCCLSIVSGSDCILLLWYR